uniref:Uncharacterized protein n=1 Tax=Opuntia streptacantha TaxID=393608 RepID=A0A7C8YM64_OPUST
MTEAETTRFPILPSSRRFLDSSRQCRCPEVLLLLPIMGSTMECRHHQQGGDPLLHHLSLNLCPCRCRCKTTHMCPRGPCLQALCHLVHLAPCHKVLCSPKWALG